MDETGEAKSVREEKIRCDACPVMCYIADGRIGACDRYANQGGKIIRCDPLTVLDRRISAGGEIRPFLKSEWDGRVVGSDDLFVTAVGSGTTYPDYKPAPFIVSRQVDGADFVTVVTEAIFSYCGVKVKIDTDRHLGHEAAAVRCRGEVIGHMMTSEYGSQMMSLGGVDHLTGGSKAEGRVTCDALMRLCNREAVELTVDDGATVVVQAGRAPIVDGHVEERMRVGCGSATIGMFASQWQGLVDEVVVVDDHITGVVSEHQAGKVLGWEATGVRVLGRRSTPGRYFQVAEPGLGWGGTNIEDPLTILGPWNEKKGARPGLTLLMVSTTGEQWGYFVLDADLVPQREELPETLQPTVDLIAENCEPALCTVMFMGGAGGSLRSGVTRNPVRLTRSVQALKTRVTCGGAPTYVWPGGGITLMADVTRMPDNSFGYVPTPAIVAPLEFTVSREEYRALGGHDEAVRSVDDVLERGGEYGADFRAVGPAPENPEMQGAQANTLEDGQRLHLHHGPIDLIVDASGPGRESALRRAMTRFGTIMEELVSELPALRAPVAKNLALEGRVARSMQAATRPFSRAFVTPMAAVAGAVADEVLRAVGSGTGLRTAYVNNGGDVAIFLADGESLTAAIAATLPGRVTITADSPVRGIATSGWRGRSYSLGIADSVTVLARSAAMADAAATLIANAVDLPGNPAISRRPASELSPDSDLADRLVTVDVGVLRRDEINTALDLGRAFAVRCLADDLIVAALLTLQGERRVVGPTELLENTTREMCDA